MESSPSLSIDLQNLDLKNKLSIRCYRNTSVKDHRHCNLYQLTDKYVLLKKVVHIFTYSSMYSADRIVPLQCQYLEPVLY